LDLYGEGTEGEGGCGEGEHPGREYDEAAL
jgi:hypothetical protein